MVDVRLYTECLAVVVYYIVVLWRVSALRPMTKYVAEMNTYVDHGLINVTVTAGINCCIVCESDKGCLSVSYSRERGICQLNGGIDRNKSDTGWISFLRYFPPQASPAPSTPAYTVPHDVSVTSTIKDGFVYPFVTLEQNWAHSEMTCQHFRGHLVDIQSAKELALVYNDAKRDFGSGSEYWIGLNDRDEEGTLVLSSSASLDYAGWMTVATVKEGYHCVSMVDGGTIGQWFLHDCNDTLHSVCKYPDN